MSARHSQSFIGASRARLARMYYNAQAVKATAHQLARLIYSMLTQGQAYVERFVEVQPMRPNQPSATTPGPGTQARQLGLELTPKAA